MIVNVKHTCKLCNSEYETPDRKQMSDKEYYLTFWNYELDTPEAEQAWQDKLNMTPRETAMVMSDIDGYVSQVDGTWIKSRSHHRSHLKQHRMIELGNDVPTQHKQADMSTKSKQARKQAIAEQVYEKLRYQ
jgi:hypothetical protein